tara:strand:+ start:69 stop:296 length:228 start_codon:yes stop_codon:yes gene_type:complete
MLDLFHVEGFMDLLTDPSMEKIKMEDMNRRAIEVISKAKKQEPKKGKSKCKECGYRIRGLMVNHIDGDHHKQGRK